MMTASNQTVAVSQLLRFALILILVLAGNGPAPAESVSDLYQSQTIVTGQGEVNRQG